MEVKTATVSKPCKKKINIPRYMNGTYSITWFMKLSSNNLKTHFNQIYISSLSVVGNNAIKTFVKNSTLALLVHASFFPHVCAILMQSLQSFENNKKKHTRSSTKRLNKSNLFSVLDS